MTPEDIRTATFSQARRGYAREEVADFLRRVARQMSDLAKERDQAVARVGELEHEMHDKGEDASAISNALVTAQRTAEQTVAEANREAEEIRAKARADADRLTSEAERAAREDREYLQHSAEQVRRVVAELRTFRADYTERVRAAVAEQLSVLDRVSELPEIPEEVQALSGLRVAVESETEAGDTAEAGGTDADARDDRGGGIPADQAAEHLRQAQLDAGTRTSGGAPSGE